MRSSVTHNKLSNRKQRFYSLKQTKSHGHHAKIQIKYKFQSVLSFQ